MEELLKILFKHATLKPQIGFAGEDKRAWLWLPGQSKLKKTMAKIIKTAPLRGCTQCAYEDWFKLSREQNCEVCWFGLDIDQDDNESIDLIEWALGFCANHEVSLVRTSCSGKGIHMVWVLKNPISCSHSESGKIIKQLAGQQKELVEAEGIKVCQANKRMFWLIGGKNETFYYSTFEHKAVINFDKLPANEIQEAEFEVSKGVQSWIERFQKAGLLNKPRVNNKVYVGDVVKFLRQEGENVYTKSRCSGNGHINGYIDIQSCSISLWSYADGHTIWTYTDVEGLL